MSNLRQAAHQALEALVTCCAEEWRTLNNFGMRQVYDEKKVNAAIAALHAALAEPEQEPVATKQMLRWVEHLKRLSDDGQHMSIPGLSSGACWELAIELDQFIKNTSPTPRKPLTDEEIWKCLPPDPDELAFARAIERAHGIGEQDEP